MEKSLKFFIFYFLFFILFLFPLFFLPFTQEFFITHKFYFLAFSALLLLIISTVQFLISKKLIWSKRPFDNLVLLFLTAMAISVVFSSPNKVQALLNPSFGLVMMASLAILYFYLSRVPSLSDKVVPHIMKTLSFSSLILSLITIVFFFQPLKNISLPKSLDFLKNPGFTPIGSQFDLAIFLGFFVIIQITQTIIRKHTESTKTSVVSIIASVSSVFLILLALFLTVYSLLKPVSTDFSQFQRISTVLPPFHLSWFASLEILKNPLTALIGAGLDNFSSVFTRVKDLTYNQSSLWQINAFNISRSAILQILTETGLFGLLAFGLLLTGAAKTIFVTKSYLSDDRAKMTQRFLFGYLLFILVFFPPSLITFFLFFLFLASFGASSQPSYDRPGDTEAVVTPQKTQVFNLSELLPIYLGIVVVLLFFTAGAVYFLGRGYAAEYLYKQSLDGIAQNSTQQVYDNMRRAIVLNPYIERFRLNFSQVNLLIANNTANRANQPKDKQTLTEQERQTITQAIQAAISEAKAAVSLNPQKAANWENLAVIYQNVINAAQEADVWTISAYQRAILADPQNPIYRINLGGVYYSLQKYDDALKFFEQAVSLKPDWPNATYNYAWANFQIKNYPQAVNAMQNTLNLLNQKTDKADYEKVQKELAEFKKMLPKEEAANPSDLEDSSGALNLPTPPATQISPKLELPKEASPEAK